MPDQLSTKNNNIESDLSIKVQLLALQEKLSMMERINTERFRSIEKHLEDLDNRTMLIENDGHH